MSNHQSARQSTSCGGHCQTASQSWTVPSDTIIKLVIWTIGLVIGYAYGHDHVAKPVKPLPVNITVTCQPSEKASMLPEKLPHLANDWWQQKAER